MRKLLFISFALLLTLGAAPAAQAQAPSTTAPTASSGPEQEFLTLADAAANLMKRLMAQPATATAEAPLQRECTALCQRAKAQRITPAYAQWLRSLRKEELRTAVQHLQASAFVQYLGKLQTAPEFEARYKRSPAAADMMLQILNAFDIERY
ncbi:hypothetical protein [Solirubrum puertoriconensis]|uniref:DUF4168 domain-containing protein n=1 Tax=Solirubrum puertoriconensis TaxID=1751427 RepID=A0A9X0HH80_SOLP1|nr:hypothetical protein [Solirubrum puertoriconensis]KUG05865.1 hypothetical protein ASU33_00295 [Solirubrum puertoriconensis]